MFFKIITHFLFVQITIFISSHIYLFSQESSYQLLDNRLKELLALSNPGSNCLSSSDLLNISKSKVEHTCNYLKSQGWSMDSDLNLEELLSKTEGYQFEIHNYVLNYSSKIQLTKNNQKIIFYTGSDKESVVLFQLSRECFQNYLDSYKNQSQVSNDNYGIKIDNINESNESRFSTYNINNSYRINFLYNPYNYYNQYVILIYNTQNIKKQIEEIQLIEEQRIIDSLNFISELTNQISTLENQKNQLQGSINKNNYNYSNELSKLNQTKSTLREEKDLLEEELIETVNEIEKFNVKINDRNNYSSLNKLEITKPLSINKNLKKFSKFEQKTKEDLFCKGIIILADNQILAFNYGPNARISSHWNVTNQIKLKKIQKIQFVPLTKMEKESLLFNLTGININYLNLIDYEEKLNKNINRLHENIIDNQKKSDSITYSYNATKKNIQNKMNILKKKIESLKLKMSDNVMYRESETIAVDADQGKDQDVKLDFESEPEARIVDYPDQEATYPGGASAMKQFLADNIKYPEISMELGDQGKVFIEFVVEKDGSITQIKVIRGVSKEIDREAKRVVKAMPKWVPAEQKGEIVRARCRIPVSFILQ